MNDYLKVSVILFILGLNILFVFQVSIKPAPKVETYYYTLQVDIKPALKSHLVNNK